MKMVLSSSLLLAIGFPAMASAAAIVVAPTSISYEGSNDDAGIAEIDDPNGLINGAGLSAPPTVANIGSVTHVGPFDSPSDNSWATNDPNGGFGNDFFASGGSQGTVVFELQFDSTYDLQTIYAWSYDFNETKPNANNFKTVTIDYGVGDFFGGTLTNVTFSAPVNNFASSAELGGITADQLRITVTDNWFDGNSTYQGGDRVATPRPISPLPCALHTT